MGFSQYFRDRVSEILQYMNSPKPDLIPKGSWNNIISMQNECLEDLRFLKTVYDGMSDQEKDAVDARIKRSQEVPKLLQQRFHGVTVADKLVKLICQSPNSGKSLELGDLSRYLTCFQKGTESSDMQEQRL